MSPAAFQPKPEVSDLEMVGGGGLTGRGLLDEPSPEQKVGAAPVAVVVFALPKDVRINTWRLHASVPC